MTLTPPAPQVDQKPPPAKRKRLSRNKTKNMRKIDITAEVAAVRAEAEEIKQHGGKLAEKEDNALFQIDTGKMDTQEMVAQVKLSKKDRYRNKTTMLDKILTPETNIKPLHQARSHSNKAEEYQQRFLARQNCGEKPLVFKHAERTGKYDLWDEKSRAETFEVNLPVKVDGRGKGHGTLKYTKEKNQMTTRQQLKKLGKEAHKMEAPLPGQSYKPTDSDHQDLLRSEHYKIVTEKEKADKLDRQVAWDKTNAATHQSDLVEVQQGLFEEDTGIVSEEEDDTMITAEKIDDNMPKRQAARNRWLADMEKQRKAKEDKAQRHQEAQIYNGKRFLREAAVEDVAIAKRKEEREEAWVNKQPRFRTKYRA